MTTDAEGRESTMRQLLAQLELTTNGTTTSWDASGAGEPDYIPRLGHSDAPHLHYKRLYNEAPDDDARARVVAAAREELDAILHSRADRTLEESRSSLYARIRREGRGFPARDVAVRFRCGVTTVHAARRAGGLDLDLGEPPRQVNGSRRAELEQLIGMGHSARQAAFKLGISYATARRDLGLREN